MRIPWEDVSCILPNTSIVSWYFYCQNENEMFINVPFASTRRFTSENFGELLIIEKGNISSSSVKLQTNLFMFRSLVNLIMTLHEFLIGILMITAENNRHSRSTRRCTYCRSYDGPSDKQWLIESDELWDSPVTWLLDLMNALRHSNNFSEDDSHDQCSSSDTRIQDLSCLSPVSTSRV